jgi:hydroxypyruvate reductase
VSSFPTDARAIFNAAVRRVQADRLLDADRIKTIVPNDLDRYDRVVVVGMGKAAMAMAGVVEDHLGDRIDGGTVIVPEGYSGTLPQRLPAPQRVDVATGGHPVPTNRGVRAAQRLRAHAEEAGPDDLLLVLISGGGTALSTLPAEDLHLDDLRHTFRLLLRSGAGIQDVNVVRKHLTQLGGGQLAEAADPAHVVALVVSDVVGDDLSTIASGPTVPDPSTFADAMRVLYRRGLWHDVATPIREHLSAGANGRRPETPSDDAPCFATARTALVGSNSVALQAAQEAAVECGYDARIVDATVEGEARDVGRRHVQTMREAAVSTPTCWLWGGETTVTVTGEGRGGRNQEVALGAALELDGDSHDTVFLSAGTDGIDGPTDAAGAWATPATVAQAREQGLDPQVHLDRNDAYSFFDALDQLLRPGPTHTNVMDVHVGLVDPGPIARHSVSSETPYRATFHRRLSRGSQLAGRSRP